MHIECKFEVNLNADNAYVDLTYVSDPIKHIWWLKIKNQSSEETYWFKIEESIPNWSITSPADGKLGSIDAGNEKVYKIATERDKPVSETTDSGDLIISVYADSEYSEFIEAKFVTITYYIEDLESWTDVAKSDFEDETMQGWACSTGGDGDCSCGVSDTKSVEAGGYSVRHYCVKHNAEWFNRLYSLTKTVTPPNKNKVRMAFFFCVKLYAKYCSAYKDARASLEDLRIEVDGTRVYEIPFVMWEVKGEQMGGEIIETGWFKVVLDLTDYKGEEVSLAIKILARLHGSACYGSDYAKVWLWLDRIVIAGEN